MNWAQRRKLAYLSGVILFFVAVGAFVYYKATSVTPTCFDGKKNGGESGIDCGGACYQYCPNELNNPKIRWSKPVIIKPGLSHAIAYIEHSYPTAASRNMKYSFKIYDDKNTLITERFGNTFLGPMGRTAIVETLIETGNLTPAVARLSFLPNLPWEKIPIEFSEVIIKSEKTLLEPFLGGTRLTATIENEARITFQDLDVVAILYDRDDNAITVSKSVLKLLPGLESRTIYFTWPENLVEKVSRVEVLPRFNPFSAKSI